MELPNSKKGQLLSLYEKKLHLSFSEKNNSPTGLEWYAGEIYFWMNYSFKIKSAYMHSASEWVISEVSLLAWSLRLLTTNHIHKSREGIIVLLDTWDMFTHLFPNRNTKNVLHLWVLVPHTSKSNCSWCFEIKCDPGLRN